MNFFCATIKQPYPTIRIRRTSETFPSQFHTTKPYHRKPTTHFTYSGSFLKNWLEYRNQKGDRQWSTPANRPVSILIPKRSPHRQQAARLSGQAQFPVLFAIQHRKFSLASNNCRQKANTPTTTSSTPLVSLFLLILLILVAVQNPPIKNVQ
ncbi:Uncharacterised protein [Escherichia coli]|nr:Uncharacterised protein [Escherichia coli]